MSKKPYFGSHVEEAIVNYNNCESKIKKERIFNNEIYPALNKLAENKIHGMNFYNFGSDSYSDTKHELVCHLYERLEKFNPNVGSKAFSYFDRVAINWIYANMRKSGEETYGRCEMIEIDNSRDIDEEFYRSEYNDELRDFCKKWASWGLQNLDFFYFRKEDRVIDFSLKDKKIANAIFNLFERSESLDIYNKKALYILIREQVDVKTQSITDVVNVLKPLCKDMYFDYKENGTRFWHRYLYYPEHIQTDDEFLHELFEDIR